MMTAGDKRENPGEPPREPTPPNEDAGHQGVDESPRLPPPDEDGSRGGLRGNTHGVTRPDPVSKPSPSAAW
jgi:hypothetical protein